MVECGSLKEARERCGVGAGVGVEEALLFEGRTEERVEIYMRMLDEMWRKKRKLMELGERAGVT